jgi:hypothetical protein
MKAIRLFQHPCILWVFAYLIPGLASGVLANDDFQGATHMMPFEAETIGYAQKIDTSRLAQLQAAINEGQATLEFKSDGLGYLISLLHHLDIPTQSQVLVFSKTSFQRHKIAPATPRALFFNEHSYVGFVQGSNLLEISAVDKDMGGVFYTLEQDPGKKPEFVRTDQCLECHASSKTMGVPGHLIRSFEVNEEGIVDLITGTSQVNHRTPIEKRWGGWYVTGQHGKQTHRGNLFGKEAFIRQQTTPNYLGNLRDLKQFFDPSIYPHETSDIVPLMILEHQGHMHNFITRMQYEAQIMLHSYGHLRYLRHKVDAFLRYLLFIDEAPIADTIADSSGFGKIFTERGNKDSKGRSLRDLNLKTRLFEYPCSYLVYSESFRALPKRLKDEIYRKLWKILTGENNQKEFTSLTLKSRKAIHEILKETLPDLPTFW